MRMAGLYTLVAFCIVAACGLTGCAGPAASARQNPVGEMTTDSRALPGEQHPASNGFEGIEWRLVEVGGVPVSLPADEKQPSIMFDPANKKATGYSGCNSFFAGYERDGAKLKFGPIGATRRACPDPETALEGVFFKALESTRGWNIADGRLQLTDNGNVLARFTMAKGGDAAADPESMTYISRRLPSGKVTLSHGECRLPAAPGSASEIVVRLTRKRVFGVINGAQAGAVILATDFGGSGTFYDLALLSKEGDGWVNTDVTFLGERVRITSVGIEDDHIVVRMITQGPEDPMCCPTLGVKRRFAIQGNRLVPVGD